jgi:hypothetical protein
MSKVPKEFKYDADRVRQIKDYERKSEPTYRGGKAFGSYVALLFGILIAAAIFWFAWSRREAVLGWFRGPKVVMPAPVEDPGQ